MSSERLQKIISAAGAASRRQAETLIQAGRVTVNGNIVTELGAKADWQTDRIELDGALLHRAAPVYLLLNKPYGVITSLSDPQGRKTVADLVTLAGISDRVYPVGRLDYDTEGLLLLTNDGELTQGLSHPKFEVEKEYMVDVEQKPAPEVLKKLEQGVLLADGMTAAAKVSEPVLAENGFWRFRIIIHEGRNRQVRRMVEAVGLVVRRLKRVRYAFLTLEGVATGTVRQLHVDEVTRLQELTRVGRE
jgi:23S rRNA pseudouridine2605 synthase